MSLCLLLVGLPLLNFVEKLQQNKLYQLQDDIAKTKQSLMQAREDITQLLQLRGQMNDEEIEKILTPVDRVQVINAIENLSASYSIEHFLHTLSQQQKTFENSQIKNGVILAESKLILEGDALKEADFYGFMDKLHQIVPGRLMLQQFTVDRRSDSSDLTPDTGVHMMATFDWIYIASLKDLSGTHL